MQLLNSTKEREITVVKTFNECYNRLAVKNSSRADLLQLFMLNEEIRPADNSEMCARDPDFC